jgi:hypothetical protein
MKLRRWLMSSRFSWMTSGKTKPDRLSPWRESQPIWPVTNKHSETLSRLSVEVYHMTANRMGVDLDLDSGGIMPEDVPDIAAPIVHSPNARDSIKAGVEAA